MKNFAVFSFCFMALLGVASVSPTETRFDRVESGFYTPLSVVHGRPAASEDSVFSFDLEGESFINMRAARVVLMPGGGPTRLFVYPSKYTPKVGLNAWNTDEHCGSLGLTPEVLRERGKRSFWVIASASVSWANDLTGVEVSRPVAAQ